MSMSKRPQHRIVKRSTGRRSTKSPPARIPTHIIKQFQQQDRQRQGVRQSFEQSQQTISSQLEFLQAQVHSWRDRCWYCTQKRFTAAHDLYQCPHGNRTAAKAWFLHVRRHIQYAPFSGCFQCGLPQVICRQWQHQGQCAYRGVMISMIAMMVHGDGTEAVRQAWQRRLDGFGVDAEDRTAVVGFLGRRHGAEEVNELVQEFVWLRKTWMEVGEIGWVGLDIVVVSRDRITRIVIRILLQLNVGCQYDWMWDVNMIVVKDMIVRIVIRTSLQLSVQKMIMMFGISIWCTDIIRNIVMTVNVLRFMNIIRDIITGIVIRTLLQENGRDINIMHEARTLWGILIWFMNVIRDIVIIMMHEHYSACCDCECLGYQWCTKHERYEGYQYDSWMLLGMLLQGLLFGYHHDWMFRISSWCTKHECY